MKNAERNARMYDEGGDGYFAAVAARERAEREKIETAAAIAKSEAEWSLETTKARRETWNAAVKAAIASNDTVNLQARLEKRFGWHLVSMSAAIVRHGL